MKNMICVLAFASAATVGADIPWQFTIEDHPAPVKVASSGASATELDGFARAAVPAAAVDLSAFRRHRAASPGSNLRSDPVCFCVFIR